MKRLRIIMTALVLGVAAALAVGPAAVAKANRPGFSDLGATVVTTAPGIAQTLVDAGITPAGVGQTGVKLLTGNGLQARFTFPISKNSADLASGTGHIRHGGGISLTSDAAALEIGKFDIDLQAGKVFAREVNYSYGTRIPVLDLDLSGLTIGTNAAGATVLSGIVVRLDPVAAEAINATFAVSLPADGSLVFGRARVIISG
ncbi:MAG TPA: hypothetical protein VFU35_13130 [Jatrophihabitans sp.]|nr:hypothetical protein [Jatrophihabitans sp.]